MIDIDDGILFFFFVIDYNWIENILWIWMLIKYRDIRLNEFFIRYV